MACQLGTYLLPLTNSKKDALKGFGLQHDIFDKVVGQVVDVNGTDTLGKFTLKFGNLIFQCPKFPNALLHELQSKNDKVFRGRNVVNTNLQILSK